MIMKDCQLLERLNSMNHYFFLDRGDLFSNFFDGCGDIMDKPTSNIEMERLESQLEMAIRTSSLNTDPFKDDVTCVLNQFNVTE